jgi:hypothetical protein
MTADPPPPPQPPEPPAPPGPADAPGFPGPEPGHDVPGPDDPVVLLVSAIGTLPDEQRDLVLTWLLRQRPAIYRHTALSGTPQAGEAFGARWPAEEPLMAGAPMRAAGATGQQVVPVRFPAEQHAQLREWCAEHGFSMATVIRGLVARFLESQAAG